MIKFRNNSIILLGDSHDLRRLFIIVQRKPNIDNLDIVSVGDNGIGFCGREFDEVYLKRISDECKKRNIRLFVQRGNHDDPKIWTERNYQFSNLFLVPDYTPAIFPNNKTALLVGGGVSIDRSARREGLDYWSDEITPYIKQNQKFNCLFGHDCPDYFNNSTDSLWSSPYQQYLLDDADLLNDALDQRNVMGQIVSDIQCEFIFSGHYHSSVSEEKFGIKYRCLNIEELLEFDSEKP